MRKICIALVAVSTLMACNTKTETKESGLPEGNLYLATEKPQRGQEFELRYTPQDSVAKNSTPEAVYYVLVNDKAYASDLNFRKKDSSFIDTVKIPDTATAIAFSFKNGDKLDDNKKKGYVFELYNNENKLLHGSTLSALNFKSGLGSYGAGIEFQQDSAAAQLKRAFAENPQAKEELKPEDFYLINKIDKELGKQLSKDYLAQYEEKQQLNEKEYEDLSAFYSASQNRTGMDSIRKLAIEAYPDGNIAKTDKYAEIIQIKDVEEKERKLAEVKDTTDSPFSMKNYIYQQIATGYLDKGDIKKFKEYASKLTDQSSLAAMYNNAAWGLAQEDKELDLAATISKKSLYIVDEELNQHKTRPDYLSLRQYKDQMQGSYRQYADTYAYILHKQGEIDQAITYQEKAVGEGTNAEMNERYVQYLTEAKHYDKAVSAAENYLKEHTASAKTKELYKEAYDKSGKDMGTFDVQLASLEKAGKEKTLAELRSNMIDEAAPQFSLKNLKGEEIALADLKGKTVVVDFWATWCGPCKESFPGMQKAVEAYQADPNVEFLFINTWESSADQKRMKEVQDFIKEKKYSFNVLMDNPKEAGSREYNVVSDFNVDGIPTKFVIGPDGRIKFKEVGYDGNNDALVEKLELMIDLASS